MAVNLLEDEACKFSTIQPFREVMFSVNLGSRIMEFHMQLKLFAAFLIICAAISHAASESAESRWVMKTSKVSEPGMNFDDVDSEQTKSELAAIRARAQELNTPKSERTRQERMEFGVQVDGGTTRMPN